MTKGELRELILQRVDAVVTGDTKVRREDVDTYLGPAINYALMKQYYTDLQVDGESFFLGEFLGTYPNVTVLTDTDRDLKYIQLPAPLLSLSKNRGIRSISPMQGDVEFVQSTAGSRQHNSYYSSSWGEQTLFWVEGEKVYFSNIPDIVDGVLVRMVASVSSVDEDEQLPVPAGLEVEIIDFAVQFFTGQRAIPADYVNDNNGNIQ